MKRFTFLLMAGCLCFSLPAFAQPVKGSMLISGGAGFNSYKYGDYSSSIIFLSPSVGYFVTDRLAAGAALDLTFYGGDDDGSYISIGPFARYYFNGEGPARFFGQAGFQFANIDFGDNSDSFTNLGFHVGAGVNYFLNEFVALEGMLRFSSDKDKDDDQSATNIGLLIGVAAFIGRK